MTVSFRSLLTIFLAVLGLFAFDGAEAKGRGNSQYGNPKNCGKRNKKCCRGDKPCNRWLACVKHNKNQRRCKPCGGNNQIVCPGARQSPYQTWLSFGFARLSRGPCTADDIVC